MIGVITEKCHKYIVNEFFELFKTPWDYYTEGERYNVLLTTKKEMPPSHCALTIIFSSQETEWDINEKISLQMHENPKVRYENIEFPVYGHISYLKSGQRTKKAKHLLDGVVNFVTTKDDRIIIRVGYDLFYEIGYLLNTGQPIENSLIPTMDLHAQFLRKCIINAGQPLVEIPPIPPGYDFICCLTHDVDFAGINNHRFDRTMLGFLYRALVKSFIYFCKGRKSFRYLCRNWKAALAVPFVHLRLVKDFWMQFEKYHAIERGLNSTFYFIPFSDHAGDNGRKPAPKARACKYNLEILKPQLSKLRSRGYEIGLHGIDAWNNKGKGRTEIDRIRGFTDSKEIGVRMHWLYFSENSGKLLEQAGFSYDSSLGYNDAIGYRNGSVQPFILPKTLQFLELPLNIQDTSMFYQERMNLSEERAADLCQKIVNINTLFGGTLTINWHHRSIAPERLWDGYYLLLLKKIKKSRVLFLSGSRAVRWFRNRRKLKFVNCGENPNTIKIELSGLPDFKIDDYQLRSFDHGSHTFQFSPLRTSNSQKK